jgi:uncharacterized protein YggE
MHGMSDDMFRIPPWSQEPTESLPELQPPVPSPTVPLGASWKLPDATLWTPIGEAPPAGKTEEAAPAEEFSLPIPPVEEFSLGDAELAASPPRLATPPPVDAAPAAPPPAEVPSPGSLGGAVGAPSVGYGRGEDKAVEDTIRATGHGEVVVPPDMMQVDLGVVAQGKTLEEVREKAASATKTFLDAVKALNVPGLVLKTRRVSIHPVHEGRGRITPFLDEHMPKIIGYSGTSQVSATLKGLPADKLEETASIIVDTATKSGANDVGVVRFGLDRPEVAARQAMKLAVEDARANAEALAEGAGLRLAQLHSLMGISGGEDFGESLYTGARARGAGIMATPKTATPIEAGDITVRRSVVGRWRFG